MVSDDTKTEVVRKSSYSDFIAEAERVIALKESFEADLLHADYSDWNTRSEVVKRARIMTSEINPLLTADERLDFRTIIEGLISEDRAINSVNDIDSRYGLSAVGGDAIRGKRMLDFEDYVYSFLSAWNNALQRHNLGLQAVADLSEINKLYNSMEIGEMFYNSMGVPVSPQMEVFARSCYVRAKKEWDNFGIVEAKQGKGKTTFDIGFCSTLAPMYGLSWSPATHFILKESREYVQKFIKSLPQFTPVVFDEAGNQFNRRSWWVASQTDLVNDIALLRRHGYTWLLNWGDFDLLDSDLRNYRSTFLITIKTRGLAVLRKFNENPYASDSMPSISKLKKRIIKSPSEAHKLLESDLLTLMTIPFYDLKGSKLWEQAEKRKDESERITGTLFASKQSSEDFYLDFLIGLDDSFLVEGNKINNDLLDRYANNVARYMSLSSLATKLARAVGTTANKLFFHTSTADYKLGYVQLDKTLIARIKKWKAEKQGAKEAVKEGEKSGD